MSGTHQPTFHGSGGPLFGIYFKTLLLSIVTLGIYSFWGKCHIRAYLYSETDIGGDRFVFHGQGGEIFRGWLKAFGLVVAIGVGATMLGYLVHAGLGIVAFYAVILIGLFPLALLGSRSYRLSRSSWRGIRFSFTADLGDFVGTFVSGVLATMLTLGLYYPYFHINVRRFLVGRSYFGDQPFEFTGKGGDIFGRFVLALLLTPLTLGFYWFWYAAFRERYYWSNTRLGGVELESTVSGGDLLVLNLVNGLLMACTLGLAYPWVRTRILTFHCERLHLTGLESLDTVRQDAQPGGAMGEGLAAMMDVDIVGADFFGL